MNFHDKFPIFPAEDDEDAESHLFFSSDWLSSKYIAEEAKCDAHL